MYSQKYGHQAMQELVVEDKPTKFYSYMIV